MERHADVHCWLANTTAFMSTLIADWNQPGQGSHANATLLMATSCADLVREAKLHLQLLKLCSLLFHLVTPVLGLKLLQPANTPAACMMGMSASC